MSTHKKLRGSVIRVEQEATDTNTAVISLVATFIGSVLLSALLEFWETLC